MEHERLPSGVFFATANRRLDVQPHIPQRHIDRPSRTNLPFRERLEFRTASSTVDGEDDRRYLPLLEVSVDVKVVATISRTTLKQTYSNHSDITIEGATYCFPLYDGSTVVEFRAWIGQERLLEGKIRPKDIARAEFHEAVSRQRAAALLEEVTPEVFETSLGNIPAHTTVKVEIQYINELKADLSGDGVLVTIPTSVAPRYGHPPQGYSRASTSNSIVEPEENGLSIQVEVSSLVPIHKLESRTHPISVEVGGESHLAVANSFRDLASAPASSSTAGFNPKKSRATLSNQTTSLGKDFVLLILAADAAILASRALIERIPNRPDHSALMVTINPRELLKSKIALENAKAEILFLADRSGSMDDKIEALKRAMRVFLKSIPENCYFNICSFGSSYSLLWPEARRYTQGNLEIAEVHIRDSFKADMGGTEILSAMKTLVEKRIMLDGVTTEVILLTDGEVWDTDDTLRFVQQTREGTDNNVRFFALGIGNAVSHRLIEGIGRQGGGFAEVVAVDTAGRWESRVIRMLKGALTPPHWNCEILLPGVTPESEGDTASMAMPSQRPAILQAPYQISTSHAFQRISVYFLVNSQLMTKLTSITVKIVTVSGETIQLEIPIEQIDVKPLTIHHLAAKAVMNDLETGQSWMHGDKCREYQKKRPADFDQALKSEAEKIGMEWSIVGKWTSFVAIDNNDQIEQKTRIYRAERSELTDLSRPRFLGNSFTHSRLVHSVRRSELGCAHDSLVPQELSDAHMVIRHRSRIRPVSYQSAEMDYDINQGDQDFYNSPEMDWSDRGCQVSCNSTEMDYPNTSQGFTPSTQVLPTKGNKTADGQLLGTLHALIDLQKSSGYLRFSDKMFRSRILGYFAPSVVGNLKEQITRSGPIIRWFFPIENITDTILIITFIEAQYPDSSELYELVLQKARGWLRKNLKSEKKLEELEKAARDELLKMKDKVKELEELEKTVRDELLKTEGKIKDGKDQEDQEDSKGDRDDRDDLEHHPPGKPNNDKQEIDLDNTKTSSYNVL